MRSGDARHSSFALALIIGVVHLLANLRHALRQLLRLSQLARGILDRATVSSRCPLRLLGCHTLSIYWYTISVHRDAFLSDFDLEQCSRSLGHLPAFKELSKQQALRPGNDLHASPLALRRCRSDIDTSMRTVY